MASDILSFIVLGYVSILSWFRSLSFLFDSRRDVRIVMVDDTIISVGSKSKVIYVAFEPLLRRILYIWVCDVANMLTSPTFLKKIRAIYGSNIVY
ncbi:MAG: hypothetical protein QXY40_07065 [Candidatus Methanomethylicia archaeon]